MSQEQSDPVSPLESIRITYSEAFAFHEGQQFDTIADFDAALRHASAALPEDGGPERVAFVLTWTDGSSCQWAAALGRNNERGMLCHVLAVCDQVEGSPEFPELQVPARQVRDRLCRAATAELAHAWRLRQLHALRAGQLPFWASSEPWNPRCA